MHPLTHSAIHPDLSGTWALMIGFGAYHGLNPGMGWLFALALGLQQKSERAIWLSLAPISIGHAVSIVLVAALPVAILANMVRIVGTALLYQFASGEAAKRFSHDLSGVVMIPMAAAMFWLFLVYLGRLFPEVELVSPVTTDKA